MFLRSFNKKIKRKKEEKNMLRFEDFVAFVTESIRDWMPESYKDAEVRTDKLCKPGLEYTGLTVVPKEGEGNATPCVNMETIYDLYKKGEDLGDLMRQMADLLTQRMDVKFDESFIREHLFIRLVSSKDKILSDTAHMEKKGLFAVAYAKFDQKGDFSGCACIRQGSMLGLSDDELLELAIKKSPETLPATLQPLSKMGMAIMTGIMPEPQSFEKAIEEELDPEEFGYVLGNADQSYGASAVLYPGILEKLEEKMGNYFILPSSVHEVLIVPDKGQDLEPIEEMVHEVNSNELAPEEFLSDDVYYYSKEAGLCLAREIKSAA